MQPRAQQKGVAVIMALMIVAIVAIIATHLVLQNQRATDRTQLLLRDTKLTQYTMGMIAWAKVTLQNGSTAESKQNFIRSPIVRDGKDVMVSILYRTESLDKINTLMAQKTQHLLQELFRAVVTTQTSDEQYFLLESVITLSNHPYRRYAFLERTMRNKMIVVYTLWHD